MPEIEYTAFLKYKEMKDKYDYMQTFSVDSKTEIAKTLAAFGAFTEGLQLFASFAILMNFPRFNKMKGMGQIVSWSVRDETLHCLSRHPAVPHLRAGEPGDLDRGAEARPLPDLRHHRRARGRLHRPRLRAGRRARASMRAQTKEYIRFIADRRLQQLGLEPLYHIEKNPLPWLDEMLNAVEHTNFFENRATEYSKASTTGTWEEAFADATFTDKQPSGAIALA